MVLCIVGAAKAALATWLLLAVAKEKQLSELQLDIETLASLV